MKFLTILVVLLSASVAQTAAVSIKTENSRGVIKVVVNDISSAALTYEGVEIRVQGKAVCNISSQFLETNRLSGLELMEVLPSIDYDYVVECEYDVRNKGGYHLPYAQKIRPRLEP